MISFHFAARMRMRNFFSLLVFLLLVLIGLLSGSQLLCADDVSPFESADESTQDVRRTSAIGGVGNVNRSLHTASRVSDAENESPLAPAPHSKPELTGKLKPSTRRISPSGSGGNRSSTSTASGQWMTTLLGLSIVIGLILSFAYAFRKHIPLATKILPPDIVEVLGRRFIDQRNCVQLIRCGNRILIVAHSPTHGLQTLGEITDPVEVDALAGRCKQTETASTTSRFEELVAGQFRSKRDRTTPNTESNLESGYSLEDEDVPASGLRLPRSPLGGNPRRELPHA